MIITENTPLTKPVTKITLKLILLAVTLTLLVWVQGIQSGMFYTLEYNIYSEYNALTLYSFTTATSMIAGAFAPLIARFCDQLGRFNTLILCMCIYTLAYAGFFLSNDGTLFQISNSLYITGESFFIVIFNILVADYVPLLYRATFYGIIQLPTLALSFANPILAGMIPSWKIIFAFTVPIIALLMIFLLISVRRNPVQSTEKAVEDSVWRSYDLGGIFLLATAICLTFLPINVLVDFDIISVQILAPLLVGLTLIVVFIIYETKFTQYPLFPSDIIKNKTIVSGFILNAIIFGASNICFAHFQPLFQVTLGIDATEATLLQVGYGAGFSLVGLPVGLVLQYFGKYKYVMTVGYLLYLVSFGLFINTRGAVSSTTMIVVVQALAGMGSGIALSPLLPAVQAVAKLKDLAMVTTLVTFTTSVSGYGFSLISTIFWNRYLPYLITSSPGGEDIDAMAIVKSFTDALLLEPEQLLIVQEAYHNTQRVTTFIGIGLLVIGLVPLYLMESFDFRDIESDTKEDQ